MASTLATERADQVAALREAIERHARYSLGLPWSALTPQQMFECVSLATRDLLIDRQLDTEARYRAADAKQVHYLSIEYLLGRMLTNNLTGLRIYDLYRHALQQMGVALD